MFAACGPDSSSGDCSDTLLAGDLVVTEVFADAKAPPGGSGTDDGKEWFEIYNNTERPVELKGLTLTHARPDGSRAKSHTMKAVTIAPGQFFTLGNSAEDLLAAYIDYGFGADLGDFFNTDGGQLTIACGSSEIDSAIYESVKEGRSRSLTASQPPDYQLNDVATNWCEANATEFEVANFGTPGSENDCTPIVVGQCNDNGTMRDTIPPQVGDLVITELMARPRTPLGANNQWFEVLALTDVDLNGVGLDRANDNNIAPEVIASPDCIRLAAGEYAVFSREAGVTVAGTPVPRGMFDFTLNPSTVMPDVQIVYSGGVVDAVTWTTSATGTSLSLDPDALTSTANDSIDNFCAGVDTYTTDGPNLGTPGAANPQCGAGPQPGMCLGTNGLRQVVKPAAGQLVITEFMANPDGTDTLGEWFEIQNTGGTEFDLNGLGLKLNTATTNVIQDTNCKSVAAGQWALFVRNTTLATNGGLVGDASFTFNLGQTNGSMQTLQVLDGTTPLDTVLYVPASSTMTPGPGVWPLTEGASKQVKTLSATTTANDDPVNWCYGSTMYGDMSTTNLGTPKAANNCP
ncbi:MAG: lamin tail domain-containing protein [Kofleriaceae bacterium]